MEFWLKEPLKKFSLLFLKIEMEYFSGCFYTFQIKDIIKQLSEQYQKKDKEIQEYVRKYDIRVKEEDPRDNDVSSSKASTGVLV